jgi:hypothetical protein
MNKNKLVENVQHSAQAQVIASTNAGDAGSFSVDQGANAPSHATVRESAGSFLW